MQHKLDNEHVAVLLLAFGGPDALSDVEPFLRNIFSGRPLPPSLVKGVRKRYQVIGGASPLTKITMQQARALKDRLKRAGRDLEISVGMRYWHPFISDVLTNMEERGIKKVLYLIMSPYCTPASTGDYDKVVRSWQDRTVRRMVPIPVTGWHTHPRYLDAVVRNIRLGLESFPHHRREQAHIIFTAHSLMIAHINHDPYVDQLRASVSEMVQRLRTKRYHLAFQSQGRGNDTWLQPHPEQILERLAHSGIREVLIAPVGFVADNLETLYDLDIVLKKHAELLGIQLQRAPSLNDAPLFIEALADTILQWFNRVPA